MNDLFSGISLQDQLGEARRELLLRKRVYAPLVARGKMRAATAERQIELMAAIVETLEDLVTAPP